MKQIRIIDTEQIKKYQKLMKQKTVFYILFCVFWIITIMLNNKPIDIIHDAIMLSTVVMILALYFTHHKMNEMIEVKK